MEIVIDTNFIVTAVKERIDLFGNLDELFGVYDLVVGEQVVRELKKLSVDKKLKVVEREAAAVGLVLLERAKVVEFDRKDVDAGIVRYVVGKKDVVVATLDRNLKERVQGKNSRAGFLSFRGKRVVLN
jgi:rRNA-processing protein FCF1